MFRLNEVTVNAEASSITALLLMNRFPVNYLTFFVHTDCHSKYKFEKI